MFDDLRINGSLGVECADNPGVKSPRWWFGGVSSSVVATVMAPLDIVKTHMQTQSQKRDILETARRIFERRGFVGFYDGFSAAVLHQMTSMNIRFSVYEAGRQYHFVEDDSYLGKLLLGLVAGACGSISGIPADLINVRMQTDMKNAEHLRHNYKHIFDALVRIPREEGFLALYKGGSVATLKASLGTCSQISSYDIIKTEMRHRLDMHDSVPLHFFSSLVTSVISSTLTHPLDVMKTLMMSGRPGQYETLSQAAQHMMRFGYIGPFRGLLPTMVRKGPATVMLFVMYEQLRLNFGKCSMGGMKMK
ncbi:uncharacterized protein Dana_GF10808, isoform D [Drosophila ananassae]|uniref:Uncharacterized protein, isoform D n=1 Tax=Drosophila ananassae TaxID=7217 RepID=A0A0N8P143_DROAN|nr:mitochondrial dicarboxylate carrier isoform X2 [Drosophila ananassae]KPU78884.1 uncharacterized protein Dana_GF10808, isoform D [Drosophila ananassae]